VFPDVQSVEELARLNAFGIISLAQKNSQAKNARLQSGVRHALDYWFGAGMAERKLPFLSQPALY